MTRTTADRSVLVAVLLALLIAAPASAAQEYQLTLDRHRPVGTKFQVSVQGTQNHKQYQTVDGKPAGEQKRTVTGKMTCVSEVLAVNKNKQVSSVALTLEKFEGKLGDQAVEVDTTKRVVVTAADGESKITYEDGTALPEDAAEVFTMLSAFMIEEDASKSSEDDMFKLKEKRAKGSSWECDNKLLAQEMSGGGQLLIQPQDIKSKFQFLDVAEFAGQEAAVFDVSVDLSNFTFAGAEQQGMKLKKSEGKMNMSGLLPLDPKSGDGVIQMQMKIEVQADVDFQGQKVKVGFEMSVDANAEYREIKE